MNIKSQKDFFSGLMFISVGLAFALGASKYSIGSSARMGAGYFPLLFGVLLSILGCVVTFTSLVVETQDGDKVGSLAWKPLFFVVLSNLVFGASLSGLPVIGLPPLGLFPGIYLLTLIAGRAHDRFNFRDMLVLATILCLVSYVALTVLLKLQLPLWPSFIRF